MKQGTLPVLPVADVDAIVDAYVQHLGFAEEFRFPNQEGVTANAQVRRGDCQIMFNLNPGDAGPGVAVSGSGFVPMMPISIPSTRMSRLRASRSARRSAIVTGGTARSLLTMVSATRWRSTSG